MFFFETICFTAIQAIEAVMRVTLGKGRFSGHLLKASIVAFYEKHKLFPKGICKEMDCIDEWSGKLGMALQRLVR